ncbi:hypothetical protein F4803DRAFT_506232 [Xylaria telfairii]|nr:hypothetical protein F4803DRAFT_506232 [Xylaria telfairii]
MTCKCFCRSANLLFCVVYARLAACYRRVLDIPSIYLMITCDPAIFLYPVSSFFGCLMIDGIACFRCFRRVKTTQHVPSSVLRCQCLFITHQPCVYRSIV